MRELIPAVLFLQRSYFVIIKDLGQMLDTVTGSVLDLGEAPNYK